MQVTYRPLGENWEEIFFIRPWHHQMWIAKRWIRRIAKKKICFPQSIKTVKANSTLLSFYWTATATTIAIVTARTVNWFSIRLKWRTTDLSCRKKVQDLCRVGDQTLLSKLTLKDFRAPHQRQQSTVIPHLWSFSRSFF